MASPFDQRLQSGGSSWRMNQQAQNYTKGLTSQFGDPMEEMFLGLRGNSGIVKNARNRLDVTGKNAIGRNERMQARYQTNQSAAAKQSISGNMQRSQSLRGTHTMGQARRAEHTFDQGILTGAISHGNRLAQRGQQSIQQSHQTAENIEAQNKAAAKQRRSQGLSTLIKVGATAATMAMFFV